MGPSEISLNSSNVITLDYTPTTVMYYLDEKRKHVRFFRSFVRSHTFYFEGTELCVGPDPYRKGSITGN